MEKAQRHQACELCSPLTASPPLPCLRKEERVCPALPRVREKTQRRTGAVCWQNCSPVWGVVGFVVLLLYRQTFETPARVALARNDFLEQGWGLLAG
jgi:hypothetical protein